MENLESSFEAGQGNMKREFLEDYEQQEQSQIEEFLESIHEAKFSFERDKYPPMERFVNIKKPVAFASTGTANVRNIWAQVPFCGSLILSLPPYPQEVFEKFFFKVSEIPKIIDFIKETGKLQVAFTTQEILAYEGLDYLDPFFQELKPPALQPLPTSIFGNEKEAERVFDQFIALANIRFKNWVKKVCEQHRMPHAFILAMSNYADTYMFLRLGRYTVNEDIENLMVDAPEKARTLFTICTRFIRLPISDPLCDLRNFTMEEIRESHALPLVYRPHEIRFPCEIGKFILRKLTYAPYGLEACKQLIYHYDSYDLQKVAESLNEAIVRNNPDLINKNAEELSEILDNVWKDPTIPRKIKGIKIGIPLSIAAIGYVAAGPIGALGGGFLAELGFKVADKTAGALFDGQTTGLSDRIAKLRTKSFQANIHDFKKKYKNRITQ